MSEMEGVKEQEQVDGNVPEDKSSMSSSKQEVLIYLSMILILFKT